MLKVTNDNGLKIFLWKYKIKVFITTKDIKLFTHKNSRFVATNFSKKVHHNNLRIDLKTCFFIYISRQIAIDEVAAATASIAQPIEEDSLVDTISLEHCAEQILSGIKKEVEVQYLVPMMAPSNGDISNNQTCTQNRQTDPLCPTEDTGLSLNHVFITFYLF